MSCSVLSWDYPEKVVVCMDPEVKKGSSWGGGGGGSSLSTTLSKPTKISFMEKLVRCMFERQFLLGSQGSGEFEQLKSLRTHTDVSI